MNYSKIIEDYRKKYVYKNKYNNIISTGLGLNDCGNVEIVILIATDDMTLKQKALTELAKTLPSIYNGVNITIKTSTAIISY